MRAGLRPGLRAGSDGRMLLQDRVVIVSGVGPGLGQANAKALIISRGANINALGTKADPIIFTSTLDTVDSQTDLTVDSRGLWGGLIMLGQARISDGKFEEAIEGIPLVGGLPDPRALYGGLGGDTTTFDDNDNSGELRYVYIRHGGSVLAAFAAATARVTSAGPHAGTRPSSAPLNGECTAIVSVPLNRSSPMGTALVSDMTPPRHGGDSLGCD